MTSDKTSNFQKKVLMFYEQHGRQFPWRMTWDPYYILVSEFMLQQTQTDRVVPYYDQFLLAFPTVQDCANAPLSEVLIAWQGLGYNRRAQYLHQTTKELVKKYHGEIPFDIALLTELPGIGAYTAAAICTFACNKSLVFIETNIRTVFINEFFFDRLDKIHDNEILPLIKETLPTHNFRLWYYALMDYGVFLKKNGQNTATQSAHYNRQSKFEGSFRQLRGKIIKILTKNHVISRQNLEVLLEKKDERIDAVLESLVADGLVVWHDDIIQIND